MKRRNRDFFKGKCLLLTPCATFAQICHAEFISASLETLNQVQGDTNTSEYKSASCKSRTQCVVLTTF